MKSYLGLVKEYSRNHKKKNQITILCIAIAVCLVTTIFGLAETMIKAQKIDQIKRNGNWHAAFKKINEETAAQIGKHTDIEVAGWLSSISIQTGTIVKEAKTASDIAIMGGDEAISGNMGLAVTEGRFPTNSGEALIDLQLMDELGILLNDTLNVILSDGRTYQVTITGTYENTSSQLKNDLHGLYFSYEGIQEIDGRSGQYNYYIQFHDGTKMAKIIDGFKESLNLSKDQIAENNALLGLAGQSRDRYLESIYLTALFLFMLVLASGVLMISSSFNMSVKERIRFFGLMRCLGASTKQVKRYVLCESIRFCLFGIPIGLLAGVVITIGSSAFLKYVNSAYFGNMPVVGMGIISILSGILVGFLTVILAALAPAGKAAKVSPQCAVSGNANKNKGVKIKVSSVAIRKKPETALGIAHALSDKKNILLMTGSFAISIILFLSFSILVDFMKHGVRGVRPDAPDISIASSNSSNSIDNSVFEKIQGISGVKRAYGRMFLGNLPIQSAYGSGKINLVSYEQHQFEWAEKERISGKLDNIIKDDNRVLIVHAEGSNLKLGNEIKIKTDKKESTVRIGGILSDSPFVNIPGVTTVICSETTFRRITLESGYAFLDIQLTKGADEDTVSQIRSLTTEEQVFSDKRKNNMEGKAAYYSFALFIYGFLVIIASITVIHIMNSMNNSISSKINIYGVMKAAGMTGEQLRRMVVVEAAVYTVCGCLVGILISLPIHKVLFGMLITSKWGLSWQIPFGSLIIVISITIVSTILSVIRPIKKLNIMNVVDVVNAQ